MPTVVSSLRVNDTLLHYKYISNYPDNPVLVVFPGGPGFGYALYEPQVTPLLEHVNLLFF
jgi:hypothetical protein